jgi:hypothetical protein
MKYSSDESYIKLFNSSLLFLLDDLKGIENSSGFDLIQNDKEDAKDETYYPQFDEETKRESEMMGKYYAVFYCLERNIRKLIAQVFESSNRQNWWDKTNIPEKIFNDVNDRIKKEIDSGITRRSVNEIDYTTFGELADIIKFKWDIFGSIFNSQRALDRVISNLNTLRNNIAHCCPLSEDEVVRLRLSVKDWFRLME